ncbi:MAG: trypsin-like peptidase domain-containing protein [Actinomycetota bacterium]|nr:trypsin-like peptidase domain-containing protein [Actinomycetota bacterium]
MTQRSLVFVALLLVVPACSLEALSTAVDQTTNGSAQPSIDIERSDVPPPRSPIAEVVEAALPSVVNVEVQTGAGEGEGSGVVIDESGIILTNFHVVECSLDVAVRFNDGEHGRLDGQVIGGIPTRDIAVVRVDANDLTPIEIGSSSNLRLGDDVLAIGFPLGLGDSPTVTRGIVSALDRRIQAGNAAGDARELEGLLQTDAAINPGNSGGALIDRAGRLVGINTAAAQAGQAENIGFAIAIDEALPLVEEILSEPPERRAWLGISVDPVETAFEAAELGLDPDVRGAGIAAMFPRDPAAEAGLEVGEVIVEIEGRPIRSGDDLTESLTEFDPGDRVDVVVATPDGSRTVTVELGRRPPEDVLDC